MAVSSERIRLILTHLSHGSSDEHESSPPNGILIGSNVNTL